MAGGMPSGDITQLTLHTGYSLRRIQQVFSANPVIDPASPTGYRKWNHSTQSMEVHDAGWQVPTDFGVPVVTLVGYFDPERQYPVAFYPLYGNYGHVYSLPEPVADAPYLEIQGKSLNIKVAMSPVRLAANEMNKFHFNIRQSDLPVRVISSNPEEGGCYIDVPPQPLDAAVVIGGPGLWERTIVPHMPDFSQWRSFPRKLESIGALEAQLRNVYGELHACSEGQSSRRRPGELYLFDNPRNAKRQYFLLKNEDGGDFPENSADNADWRFLGNMNRFVNIRPNPLKSRQINAPSLDAAICAYYQTSLVKCPSDATTSGPAGRVWFRESDQGYYLQRTELAACTDLLSGTDNAKFFFLGFATDLKPFFQGEMSQADFEARTLAWYDIPRFLGWDERGEETIGEIFRANFGKGDYFALQSGDAGFYPNDQKSGNGWFYLGSCQ